MEQVKFTKPINKLRSADWKSEPASLNNAYLDRQTNSAKRVGANVLVDSRNRS
jgi:hypothetical protein